MISWIKGELVSSWQANNKFYILVNCQGLGYEIQTLESVFFDINSNKISEKEIILWLKHIKKEDSDMLFGFSTKDQRDFFIQILNIKGIGSQIGMSLLNKFSLNQLITAISNNDKKSISTVQGIGQKMTERIILELKSKVINKEIEKENLNINNFLEKNKDLDSIFKDIDLTLQSLNYSKKEIKNLFPKLINNIKNSSLEKESISFENLLKEAMNYLDHK
ncbi:putative holliday junction DNA helicase RuvA [Prochlorococcus marinus subsp. pastoris str. CCMP1986]|uniref:Holliday junction branch migration complex subunit RuvA n=1 Tax=Prochlorococcus marinus subsp. pastoris (strain CCMP1986 / NIES-2087 / MED4) TaxID=59919 RepID=RUVA_PROMP|nr:Holliday junction branch migration protein RuvA [Prochlorococcus marinus]Q7V1D3.1 RecName: Full=Holliday junction branch migration complex subunit RuvA [Prochlorococcus marinus subsp. pastoris str. CCMP1986]KGF87491.1 Holliday junction DNA helicase RuvA [Prochlorococcus marinus str. EQPAC1]CAE19401.1 putative holliday junction DNA helicase RuvA [Prochlorococcus marinus subsp. pastoris str. CCMP1986]